jgi:hypothetical protein
MIAVIYIDNVIDLITNSSSELFVIAADKPKEIILALVNDALKDYLSCVDFEERYFEGTHSVFEEDYMLKNLLENFPEKDREEVKAKYFSAPKYYGVVFDRDWDYAMDYAPRQILEDLGFTLIDSDH